MVERAKYHAQLGKTLFQIGNEWAAVTLFYASYHMVKASFVRDPVFDDPQRLFGIDDRLRAEDRFETKHSYGGIGRNAVQLGVNEIVTRLYPRINRDYGLLHLASCDVRYRGGLRAITHESVRTSYETILGTFSEGLLVA